MRRKRICVFMSEIVQVFQHDCCKAIMAEAKKRDLDVFVYASFGSYSCPYGRNLLLELGEKNIVNFPDFSTFEAVIAVPDTFDIYGMDTDFYEIVSEKAQCPVINLRSGDSDHYLISIDNRSTMAEMTRHFIRKHGFTKICYMSGPFEGKDSPMRLQGYRDAMAEAGLEVTDDMVFEGNYWRNKGKEAMDHFLSGGKGYPEAIVCANDYMALSICEELKKRGKKVPDDVCVSGLDGIEEGLTYIPSLTGIVIDPKSFVSKAFDIFDKVTSGENVPLVSTIDGTQVLHASCGCGDQYAVPQYNEILEKFNRTENLLREAGRLAFDYQNNYTMNNALAVADYYFHMLDCDKGYLCLSDFEKDNNLSFEESHILPDKLTLRQIMHIEGNINSEITNIEFLRKDILPVECFDTEEPNLYILIPLHYKSKPYGYLLLDPGEGKWINSFLNVYINSLSTAVENCINNSYYNKMSDIQKISMTDPLTGLLNRRGFEFELQRIFSEHGIMPDISIASIDLDRLKFINDSHGHNEGDFALKKLAEVINGLMEENEVCARFGGDEFCAVLFNTDKDRAERFEADFEKALIRATEESGKPYPIHASIGISEFKTSQTSDIFTCFKIADEKMYARKRAYKSSLNNKDL